MGDCRLVSRRRFVLAALAGVVVVINREALASPRSLAELGRRFQVLRRQHAQAKSAFDRWGSELHKIMTELGERLGVAGTKSARVIAIMGEPDKREVDRWCYLWRGWHDYLYFDIAQDRVVGSDWFMAGE